MFFENPTYLFVLSPEDIKQYSTIVAVVAMAPSNLYVTKYVYSYQTHE